MIQCPACFLVEGVTAVRNGKLRGQELVAHTCNPNYWGDRNQDDLHFRPAWEKS
jgi:hypothetical protein